MLVDKKNIIITGCLQGIGKETVKVFASNGANVFACTIPIVDNEIKNEFELFCKDLEKKCNVFVIPIYFDMADYSQIKTAIKEIQVKKVQIDGLVNISGINRDANFGMITEKDLQDTFQVNVFSQIIFTQYVVRLIQRYNNKSSIIFTSSITALDGNEGQITYGASKAALIGAMRSMAKELGKSNIRVNCVAPGVIKSPMTDKVPIDIINDKIKRMDIPKLGEPSNVAELYMYLISDLSSHVTGQVIRIDGGM